MDMIIKNGTVVTASDMFKADIGIENGKIVEISGKIDESKRPHKVFYHNDIYEDETEKLFAHIKSRVANIIDQKILKHDTITLTRKELILLKRYMLICSIRTQTPDGFAKIIRGFESNAMHYISIYNNLYNQKITLQSVVILDRLLIKFNYIKHMIKIL